MPSPRLSFAGCRENDGAQTHSDIKECRQYSSEVGTDPHPTLGAEDVTVHDEKR